MGVCMLIDEICNGIIKENKNILSTNKKIGNRMICQEYSVNTEEKKLFPENIRGDVFVLYWMIEEDGSFYSSMIPSDSNLIYTKKVINGEKTQLHTHDYIELGYVVKGGFKQKILGKDISFKQGELFLIDKNCIHQDYLFKQDAIIFFIGMSNKVFDEIMVENIEEKKISNFIRQSLLKQKNTLQYLHFSPKEKDNKILLEENLIMLIKELSKDDSASKYITKGIIMRILNLISVNYTLYLSIEQKRKMTSFVVDEIKEYIHENYADVTIKDLAKKFHFNDDYFNRILKQKEGMTYSEYVQSIRIKEAIKLLLNTNKSIEEISRIVGYNNKGYFYKIFLEKYGITPATYRKNNIKT